MSKYFNAAADCKPAQHYMVNLDERLAKIKKLIDHEAYFTINRARQYGKTTTLRALNRYLQEEYYVISLDFQRFGAEEFTDENTFSLSFAKAFLRAFRRNSLSSSEPLHHAMHKLEDITVSAPPYFRLQMLFEYLSDICSAADKPIVLMIDEVDSASNNQVFLDFLAQLRAYYIDRDVQPTFQSVILAGVYDVKHLKQKLRPEDDHKLNSPWNIASDFNIDMSFSKEDIMGMLQDYEDDHHTHMDVAAIAALLYDYTSGYPFLVSKLCKLMDENISTGETFNKEEAWTRKGFLAAVRTLLTEKNTLFESLIGKLHDYPDLDAMLRTLLFTGRTFAYSADESSIDLATMFGFIKNQNGTVVIANRIFETRLYNYYLSEDELQRTDLYKASLQDKNQFLVDGHLNMRKILERFVVHFTDIYGTQSTKFLEEEGRQYFLLYLRPIINGVGNYYIEARTRDLHRTDIIVDYRGEQYIIEMKIWYGQEYLKRGEKQLIGYLDEYHIEKGYMLSFNFNKEKVTGIHEVVIGDKMIIEAVV